MRWGTNVVTNGHWWYSNIPSYIELDTRSRLEAVPRTKQIGYYSDMYKLEFGLPKFRMYRRILAKVLSEDFVIGRGWLESRAIELGKTILRGWRNTCRRPNSQYCRRRSIPHDHCQKKWAAARLRRFCCPFCTSNGYFSFRALRNVVSKDSCVCVLATDRLIIPPCSPQ